MNQICSEISAKEFHGLMIHNPFPLSALPPEITTAPEKQARTVDGKTVTLSCRTFGAPKPIVKWFHDNDELTGGRYAVTEEGDLEIK